MRGIKVGPNFAIFVLFFGIAFVEAMRHGERMMPVVYIVLALLFLRAEGKQGSKHEAEANTGVEERSRTT